MRKLALSTKKPITLALGISGGGYRAFLNGAGMLSALDDRTLNSTQEGHLGGLLQGATYIAGISGGSWTLMSLILSDFMPLVKLRHEWDMFEPLLEGIPNLAQIEVSRADIQVLPAGLHEAGEDFYQKLNNIDKRDQSEDYFEGFAYDDVFEAFYSSLELLSDLDADEDENYIGNDSNGSESQDQGEVTEAVAEVVIIGPDVEEDPVYLEDILAEHSDNISLEELLKQAEPADALQKRAEEQIWAESVKTFFKDVFKKKEEPKVTAQNILPGIQFSKNLSLKNMRKIFSFYKSLHLEVCSKKAAGYPVSFTDYWGRALSRRVFPKNSRSPNITFSGITNLTSFSQYQQPFPIIISNLREPGLEKTSVNSSLFEFTPYEFGSFDFSMFCDLRYLGTLLNEGEPLFHINNRSICHRNFDNAGFITGTSSSLFNNVLIYVWQLAASSSKQKSQAIRAVLNTFGLTSSQNSDDPKKHPDYALYSPNPFFHYGDPTNKELYLSKNLYMVDGGEDGQNIPYQPFMQAARQVDVILSIDSTADIKGWPNGTIIQNTYLRYNATGHSGTTVTVNGMIKSINLFPDIPDPEEFVDKGLNKRPVFFGCHLEKYHHRDELPKARGVNSFLPPIIGYFGNTEYSYPSDTSTFKLTYGNKEINKLMENAYNIVTAGNSTTDEDYPRCVGCILIKREFDRKARSMSILNDMEIPDFCNQCYNKYCYN